MNTCGRRVIRNTMSASWDLIRHVWTAYVIFTCVMLVTLRAKKTQAESLSAKTVFHIGDAKNGRHEYVYPKLEDLNIGAVFSVHEFSHSEPCGKGLRETGIVQLIEAMVFAIDQINKDPSLLPNVTLGHVILDDCMKPTTALAQTLHFMPMNSRPSERCERNCYRGEVHSFYDVFGVIGAESSPASIMMANLLGIFQIPQISPTSTSDLLSDKKKYPYFLRMMPPDRFQVRAILGLLLHFNWTYVNTIYVKGGYGEDAVEQLGQLAKYSGVCIGASVSFTKETSDKSYFRKLIWRLYNTNARVVVLFIDQEEARYILLAAQEADLVGHFVWVGSDGIGVNMDDFDGLESAALGALSFRALTVKVPEFDKYFKSVNPTTTKNPWFKDMWSELFKCTWHPNPGVNETVCSPEDDIVQAPDFEPEVYISIIIDTVYAFARAMHNLIQANCANLRKTHLRECVKNAPYLSYLKNLTFSGLIGNITFNENGDLMGRYEILNYQKKSAGVYKAVPVGVWDSRNSQLDIDVKKIVWNVKDLGASNTTIPLSFCGQDCATAEIYVYHKETCCWECRRCNTNEITVDNNTRCRPCSPKHWPDRDTRTQCEVIPPDFMRWHEPLVLVLVTLALSGISFSCIIFVVFTRNNDARIIKATSRELSFIMLGGVAIQYLLVFTFVSKPEPFACFFNYIGFNVSFTVVYGPLLTRTNRIYRIFKAGRKTKVLPNFTSPLSQVIITLSLILSQIIINVIVTLMSPPEVRVRMPVLLERYTELVCALPMKGFITSLSFNLLLVFICTVYAFKTRTLPDNFNESRCITLCVYTTLVIWCAFLPTYFTTSRAYYQIILISCALLFNATVTLLCLYVPRIYALNAERKGKTQPHHFKYAVQKCNGSSTCMNFRLQHLQIDDPGTELSDYGPVNMNVSTT